MSSNSNKTDKNKKQFLTVNINKEYKGKSAEQKPRQVRQYGMQHVGTLKGIRRMPPPAYIPSIRAETGGNDPRVNLVPTGSSGWGGVNGATPSPNDVGNPNLKSTNQEPIIEERQDAANANWASATSTISQNSSVGPKPNIPAFYGLQSEFPKLKGEERGGSSMNTGGVNDGRPAFSATGITPVSLRPQTTPSNWLERQKIQPNASSGGEETVRENSGVDSLGDSNREFGMTENGLFDVSSANQPSLGIQKPFNSYSRQPQTNSVASSQSAQKPSNNPTFTSSRDQSSNNHQSDIAATGWAAVNDEPNYEEKIVFSDEDEADPHDLGILSDSMKALTTSDNSSASLPEHHNVPQNAESNSSKDEISHDRAHVLAARNRMQPPPRDAWSGPPSQPYMPPYGHHPFSYGNASVMPPHFYHNRVPLNSGMQSSGSLDQEVEATTADGLKEQRNARNQDYKLALERAQKKKQEKVRLLNSGQQKEDVENQSGNRHRIDSSNDGDNLTLISGSSDQQPSSGPPIISQSGSSAPAMSHQPSPHMPPSMPHVPFAVGHHRFVAWQNFPPANPMHSVMPPTAIYPNIFPPSDPKLVEKFFEFLQHQQAPVDPSCEINEEISPKDKLPVTEQNDPFAEDDIKTNFIKSNRRKESSGAQPSDNVDNARPSSTSSDQQHPRILKRENSHTAQQNILENEVVFSKISQDNHDETPTTKTNEQKETKSSYKKDERNKKGSQSNSQSSIKPKPQPLMEKPIQPANSEVRKFEEKVAMEDEKRERSGRGNERMNRGGWSDDQWNYDYYYYDNRGPSHYRRNDQDYSYQQWNKRPRGGVKRYTEEQGEQVDEYLESGRNQREIYNRTRGQPRDGPKIPYHSIRGSRGRSYIRGGSTRGRYRETSTSHIRSKESDNRRVSKTKKDKGAYDEHIAPEEHSNKHNEASTDLSASTGHTNEQTGTQQRSKNSKLSGSRTNKKEPVKSKDDTTKSVETAVSNANSKNDEKSELTAAPPPPVNVWNTKHPLIDNSKGNSGVNSDSNDKSEPPSASRSKQGTPSKEIFASDDKVDNYKDQRIYSKSGDAKPIRSERSNHSRGNRRGVSRRGVTSGYDDWSGVSPHEVGNKRGYHSRRNYDSNHGMAGASYRGDRSGKSSRGARTSRGGYETNGMNSQSSNNTTGKNIPNKNGRDKRQTSVSKDIVSDNNDLEEWETASEGSESMPTHRNESRRGNGSSDYGGCSNRRGGGGGQGPGSGGGSASGSGSGNYGAVNSSFSGNKSSSSCGEGNNHQNSNTSNGGKSHRMAGTNNNSTNTSTLTFNSKISSKEFSTSEKPRSLPSHIEIHNIASVVDIANIPDITEEEELIYDGPEQFQEVLSKTTRKKQKMEEMKRQNQIIEEGKSFKPMLGGKMGSSRLGNRGSKSSTSRKPANDRQSSKALPPRLAKQKPASNDDSGDNSSSGLKSESQFSHSSALNKSVSLCTPVIKPLLDTAMLPSASLDANGSAHRIEEKPVVIDSWDSRLADKMPAQKHKVDSSTSLPKPIGTPAPAQNTTRSSVEKDSGSRDSGVDTGEAGSSNRSSPKGLPLRTDPQISKSSARTMPFIAKQVKEVPVECDPPNLTTYASLDNYADKQEDEIFAFCHLDQNEIVDKTVSVVKDDSCDNTSQERLDSKINSVKNLWYNSPLETGVDNRPLDIATAPIECGSNSSTVQALTVSYASESDSVSSSGVNSSSNQTNICKVRPQLQQQQQTIDQRSSVTPTQSLENASASEVVSIVATCNASSNPSNFVTSNTSQLLPPFSSGTNATFPNFYAQQGQHQAVYQQQDMLSNSCFSVEPALQGNRWSATNGALPNTTAAYGFIQQQRPPVNIPKPIQQPMITQPGAQQPINYNPVIMHKFVSVPPNGPNLQQNQSQLGPVQFAASGTHRQMTGETPQVANNSIANQLFAFYQRQNSAAGPQQSIQLAAQTSLPTANNLPQSGNSSGFPGSAMNSFSGNSPSGVNMAGSNMMAHQNPGGSYPQQMKPTQHAPFAMNRQPPTPQQSAYTTLGSNPTLAAASMGGFGGSNSMQPQIPQYGYAAAPPKSIAVSSQMQYQSTQNRGLDSLSNDFPFNYPLNSGFASDLASGAYNNSSGSLAAFNNMSTDNLLGFKAIPQSQGFIPSSFQSNMFPHQSGHMKPHSSQPSSHLTSVSNSIDNSIKHIAFNDQQRCNLSVTKDSTQSANFTKFPNPKTQEEPDNSSMFANPSFYAPSNQRDKRSSYQQNSNFNSSQKPSAKTTGKSAPITNYNRKNSSPVSNCNSGGMVLGMNNLGYENTQMTTETAGVLAKMPPEELQRFVMQMRKGPVAALNQNNMSGGLRIGPSRGNYQDFDSKKGAPNKRPGSNFPPKFGGGNRPSSQTNTGLSHSENPEILTEDESKLDSDPGENKSVDSPPVSSLNRPVIAES